MNPHRQIKDWAAHKALLREQERIKTETLRAARAAGVKIERKPVTPRQDYVIPEAPDTRETTVFDGGVYWGRRNGSAPYSWITTSPYRQK